MTEQKESVKAYFDNISDEYEVAYSKDVADSLRTYIFLSRREYVLSMIDLENGNVLDIGCGPGILTEDLLKRNFRVWNIDISEGMVEKARQRMRIVSGAENAYFSVGDIEKLDFADKFFDLVLCVGVLEYLSDDTIALREIARVLKPGGSAILTVPNMISPFALLEKAVIFIAKTLLKIFSPVSEHDSLLFRDDITDRYYYPWRLNAALKNRGFKISRKMFHAYRLAFLNLLSVRISFSFAKRLEWLKKTPLSWMGVNYIVKVTRN